VNPTHVWHDVLEKQGNGNGLKQKIAQCHFKHGKPHGVQGDGNVWQRTKRLPESLVPGTLPIP
jgi:hypothetical protein